jgi:hypothetical protein
MIPDIHKLLGQLDLLVISAKASSKAGKGKSPAVSPAAALALKKLQSDLRTAARKLATALREFENAMDSGAVTLQPVRNSPAHQQPTSSNFNRDLHDFLTQYDSVVERGALLMGSDDPSGTYGS